MNRPAMNLTKGMGYGVLFGIVAGLSIAGIGYALPIPMMPDKPPFFVNTIEMASIANYVAVGWVLHLFTSAVIGGIVGFIVTRFDTFNVRTVPRMLFWGVVTGMVAWCVLFLPAEIPAMPGLFDMDYFLAESLGYNIVYGLVLAGLLGLMAGRSAKPITP